MLVFVKLLFLSHRSKKNCENCITHMKANAPTRKRHSKNTQLRIQNNSKNKTAFTTKCFQSLFISASDSNQHALYFSTSYSHLPTHCLCVLLKKVIIKYFLYFQYHPILSKAPFQGFLQPPKSLKHKNAYHQCNRTLCKASFSARKLLGKFVYLCTALTWIFMQCQTMICLGVSTYYLFI